MYRRKWIQQNRRAGLSPSSSSWAGPAAPWYLRSARNVVVALGALSRGPIRSGGGHTKCRGRGPLHGSPPDAPSCPAPRPCLPPPPSVRSSGGCGCAHHPTSRTGTTTRTAARLEPRLPLLPPTAAARQRMAAAPGSLACSSRLSRLADLRRTPAAPAAGQQVHLGCSRRRAQRTVAMAGSGKVRRRLCL